MMQLWQLSLLVLLMVSRRTRTQTLATNGVEPHKPEATLFYMDGKGNYKYAFTSGNGIEGEQSADQANEVTGYYTYSDEQGTPYMVKYSAGVLGYRPEVIRPSYGDSSSVATTAINTPKSLSSLAAGPSSGATAVDADALQSTSSTTASTLKFVQHAMRSMQTQPLHVSFATQQSHLPAPPETLPQQPSRPYAYSYLSDQSAHSESVDRQGNVLGSYSYYDEAGFHDLAYSAGHQTGFVILGGNLVKLRSDAIAPVSSVSASSPNQLEVNVAQLPHGSYNYKVAGAATKPQKGLATLNSHEGSSSLSSSSGGGRSLRKFRRYAKW